MQHQGAHELSVPLLDGLKLLAGARPAKASAERRYPTDVIQKGLRLEFGGRDLTGEGLGLAAPVVRYGSVLFFPGDVKVDWSAAGGGRALTLVFALNLVERLALGGGPPIQDERFYRVREALSRLHRRHKRWRSLLSWGGRVLKDVGDVSVLYSYRPSMGTVSVTSQADTENGRLVLSVDLSELDPRFAEVSMMNEQDGAVFDSYWDACTGELRGTAISSWAEVRAARARLVDPVDGLYFELPRVHDVPLWRGREVVPGELSWAGLAHVLSPGTKQFSHEIQVGMVQSALRSPSV